MDSAELYAKAKRTARLYLTGWARQKMHPSAVFYWRCRATTLLRQAIATR